jgi:hypothetical protein
MGCVVEIKNFDLCFQELQPSDTVRMGKVAALRSFLDRIVFSVREFFSRQALRDELEFKNIHPLLTRKIEELNQSLLQTPEEALPEVVALLKLSARISNSLWGKSLSRKSCAEYGQFLVNVERTRRLALNYLSCPNQAPLSFQRWIAATETQRRFAVYCHREEVPYRIEELPPGAVLLTDPKASLLKMEIEGQSTMAKICSLSFKGLLCFLATGRRLTHAELYLGDGSTFDLAQTKDLSWNGQGMIRDRKDKVFYGHVMLPNRQAMLAAYNERFPEDSCICFEELWAKIDREARSSAENVKANFRDIINTGFPRTRRSDYDCTKAWDPATKHYSCSATISALFGKFNIDIGKQFEKMDQNITPTDFFLSTYFTHQKSNCAVTVSP